MELELLLFNSKPWDYSSHRTFISFSLKKKKSSCLDFSLTLARSSQRRSIRPRVPAAFQWRPKTFDEVEVTAALGSLETFHSCYSLINNTFRSRTASKAPPPNFSHRHLFGAGTRRCWCNCLKVIPQDVHLCIDGGRMLSAGTGINGSQAAITSRDERPPDAQDDTDLLVIWYWSEKCLLSAATSWPTCKGLRALPIESLMEKKTTLNKTKLCLMLCFTLISIIFLGICFGTAASLPSKPGSARLSDNTAIFNFQIWWISRLSKSKSSLPCGNESAVWLVCVEI